MTRRTRMLGGVTVWRVVATPRPATLLARPQMHPARPDLHAVLAFTSCGLFDIVNGGDVSAPLRWHEGLLLLEHLMNEGDGNRSFADGRRDPLDVTAAHVSNRKDAGTAGFKQMRRSRQRPFRLYEIVR